MRKLYIKAVVLYLKLWYKHVKNEQGNQTTRYVGIEHNFDIGDIFVQMIANE